MKRVLESLLGPDAAMPRWFAVAAAMVLAFSAVVFFRAAASHAERQNLELTYNDQKVYMNIGAALWDMEGYYVPRMRMPLYGVYTGAFYRHGMTVEDFFPIAKRANIYLALVCVAAVAWGFHFWLGWGLAWPAALLTGAAWYWEKAGYVQPEALLATIIGLSCAMLAELLRRPAWWKGALAGLMLAAWHMTKASGPVILGIFLAVWSLKMIWPGQAARRSLLIALGVLIGSFVLPITPYCIKSWQVFGSPLYNTQSKFYVWCETMQDKHKVQRMDVDILPPTPEQLAELPSAEKFLAKHGFHDIRKRIKKGGYYIWLGAFDQHPELFFAVAVCLCLLLLAIGLHPRKAWALAKERWPEMLLALGVLAAFSLLFFWMQPIRVGPRMLTSIHLVPLFFSLLWMREIFKGETWRIAGMTLSAERAIAAFILLPLAAVIAWIVGTLQLPAVYFGG